MYVMNKFQAPNVFMRACKRLLPAVFVVVVSAAAFAQEPSQPSQQLPPNAQVGDLINHLNLSPDQIEKIKAIGTEQKIERQLANRRVREAEQGLDRAIYVENADDSVITARAKEVAEARSEMVRLQSLREAKIRRILTGDQLATFLALRDQIRQNLQRRRMEQRSNTNANNPAANPNAQGFRPGDGAGQRKFGRGQVGRRLLRGAGQGPADSGQKPNTAPGAASTPKPANN